MASHNRYRVVFRLGEDDWREYLPAKETILLGREADADIPLDSFNISRRHASISFQDNGPFLSDLG